MNATIFPLRSGKSYLVQVNEYLRSEDRWVVRAVRKFTNPREADEYAAIFNKPGLEL